MLTYSLLAEISRLLLATTTEQRSSKPFMALKAVYLLVLFYSYFEWYERSGGTLVPLNKQKLPSASSN